MLAMRQLLGGLHPGSRQSARNRMLCVEDMYLKGMPRPVPRIETCTLRNSYDASFVRDHQAGPEAFVAPPQADHIVICRPFEERIVGGVIDHQAAARSYVILESLLDPPGPSNAGAGMPAVEIVDDHAIPGEIRIPRVPRRSRSICQRAGRDVHSESPGFEQQTPQTLSSRLPVVVVDPIDNQNWDLVLTS